jgi:hypothetical protein
MFDTLFQSFIPPLSLMVGLSLFLSLMRFVIRLLVAALRFRSRAVHAEYEHYHQRVMDDLPSYVPPPRRPVVRKRGAHHG